MTIVTEQRQVYGAHVVRLGWDNKNILVRFRHKKYFIRFRKKQCGLGYFWNFSCKHTYAT